jgi:hypothetical protein
MAPHDPPILEYATPASPQGNLIRLVTALACAILFNALTLLASAAVKDAGVILNRSLAASALFWFACATYLVLIRCRPSATGGFLMAYGCIPWVALVQFAAESLHAEAHAFAWFPW